MGDLSSEEKRALRRLITLTAEEIPIGQSVDCSKQTTVTPVIRDLCSQIQTLRAEMNSMKEWKQYITSNFQSLVYQYGDLRYIRLLPDTDPIWFRKLPQMAQGPLETSGTGYSAMVADTFDVLYYWETNDLQWWSVDTLTEQWGGSSTSWSGFLKFAGNATVGASGLRGAFNHLNPFSLIGAHGACDNDPALLEPHCVKIEVWGNNILRVAWRWPEFTPRWSQSFNGANIVDFTNPSTSGGRRVNITVTASCAGPAVVYPQYPKVELMFKHRVDDGIVPPS